MQIKKLGHCCLLIQIDNLKILTDPGIFSPSILPPFSKDQNNLVGINLVLITHEHSDHLHVESLKEVIKNNPEVKVITNTGVSKVLDEAGIPYSILEGRNSTEVDGVFLEAFDCKHEEIFEEIGQVQNTGYFIANKLFYPGDSYCNPEKSVEVLALPVAGPWCKIPDAIRYALSLKPKKAFPVHDGMLQIERIGGSHKIPEKVLTENGIEFVVMNEGDEKEF
ncbi:MAG TPA: MBL fold metallo-hydrolase [Candidatus Paceibacterota bacterium]|nr:MBL fold metallo-hydrolase [Candidatus Paceibacterota bacterium]